jgi:carbonic anhydrase
MDDTRRLDRLVELNVLEQCINILKIDHVQRSWFRSGLPKLYGWVFDVRTGKLIDLKLNMEEEFRDVRRIYDLRTPNAT